MNIEKFSALFDEIAALSLGEQVEAINEIKTRLHELSPFKNEPVDCVLWVPIDSVKANEYNPNKVAPPEMQLLELSIEHDGYTQPIVSWQNGEKNEVVDGFHRNRVGRESPKIRERICGYLPIVRIRDEQKSKSDRIASTIRHNRARGKHVVDAMSEIVLELKARNWTNDRIARELGMDHDEILRLCQITGLESLFADEQFSKSWNIEDTELEIGAEFEPLTDDVTADEREEHGFRIAPLTSDEKRVFHTYEKWECFKAGFYATSVKSKKKEQCEREYGAFLADLAAFRVGLKGVTGSWKNSCEHYLTNKSMNRIAWLGQAAACYSLGIPYEFRGGYQLLSDAQKEAANLLALEFLNAWLTGRGEPVVTLEEAMQIDRQIGLY